MEIFVTIIVLIAIVASSVALAGKVGRLTKAKLGKWSIVVGVFTGLFSFVVISVSVAVAAGAVLGFGR